MDCTVLPVSFFDQTRSDSRFCPLESGREYWTCATEIDTAKVQEVLYGETRRLPLLFDCRLSPTDRITYVRRLDNIVYNNNNNNNFINLLKKAFQLNLQCQISKT